MHKIDIILPQYKPHGEWRENIVEGLTGLRNHFAGKDVELTAILVNDGSDLSFYPQEDLDAISASVDGRFRFLTYDKNHGKGYSLRFAASQATGDIQVYTDGDFPFGWESVAMAAESLLAGNDVAMGVRNSEYGNALCTQRRIISSMVLKLNKFILGIPPQYSDTQAGMKGFNAKGRHAFLQTKVETFVFDMEFIMISHKLGLSIATIPLKLRQNIRFSKMGWKIMLREFLCFLGILWRVRVLGKVEKL